MEHFTRVCEAFVGVVFFWEFIGVALVVLVVRLFLVDRHRND